ncbi:YidC/Oxa1 family membrane protein insertase [Actinotalea subterranea]|uniref:YidC/Oxa1 family membrane protein insertase n=1 Tax=Actinotalea subterranea TaxID=2607497 RepID=UPI0011EFA5D9|nr:membrane protein insertase YidC [Actinotalea subterranea]
MDPFTLPPVAAALDLTYRGLMALTDLLEPVAGAAAAAAAVILVTLLVRTVLIPVGIAQARAERTRARLAPRLAELQRRHRKDPEALQRATMQLYADEGTSPFAGCLPVLAQAPVVSVIYAVFIHQQIAGHGNDLLGQTLAGVPLGTSLAQAIGAGASVPTLAVFAVLVAAIAVVGELTRRAVAPGGLLAPPATGSGGTGAATPPNPLAAPGMQGVMGVLQFMSAAIACVVPLAAGLYLLVTVWWTFGQRVLLRRLFPFGDAVHPARRAA